MVKIPGVERVSKEEVLARSITSRKLWRQAQLGRDKMIGRVLKHDNVTNKTTKGSIEGRNSSGPVQTQIKQDVHIKCYREIKKLAQESRSQSVLGLKVF